MERNSQGPPLFSFLCALLALCAVFLAAGECARGKSLKPADSYTPLPTMKLQQEREIAGYRETFVKAGDLLVRDKNYRKACTTYQKLLDILFKKSVDSNFDIWMGAYGTLYKETDLKLKRAKVLFLENRRTSLAAAYQRKLAERMESGSPAPRRIIKRLALPRTGSLAVDGKLIVTTFNTESPPINSNHIIGVYDAEAGDKLFDDTPIPDDRKKPQITRWGGIYVMTDPQWSPDGTRYAYFINGALCVNDDGSGTPALISNIEDSDSTHDIHFWWSPDAKKLAYLRKVKGKTTLYWNTLKGDREQKIMEGDGACFSSDSGRIAILSASKVFLHTLATGKTEQLCSGDGAAFSPDDSLLAITAHGTSAAAFSLSLRDLRRGTTRELFNSAHPAFSPPNKSSINGVCFLSRSLVAFNIASLREGKKVTDLWICPVSEAGSPSLKPLSSDGRTALIQWLNTPTEVATERELLRLGR
jgi:hypothetical protein